MQLEEHYKNILEHFKNIFEVIGKCRFHAKLFTSKQLLM